MICSTWESADKIKMQNEKVCLYDAREHSHHFCHHPALGGFHDKLYAMWSNGVEGEDEIGQRVLYAVSSDGLHWSSPRVLINAFEGTKGQVVLTAAGFYSHGQQMNAYVAAYEYENQAIMKDAHGYGRVGSGCTETKLYALVTNDGINFSSPIDLSVPICPNYGPIRLSSGRLLLTGNWAHAYTDDEAGLSGWRMRGFCPDTISLPPPVRDDPCYFRTVSVAMKLPGALCEGAFIQTKDGVLHMLHRSYGAFLYESDSADQGETWSVPIKTDFSNGNSKFWLGTLPCGQYACISNPGPDTARCPLALSLSEDGMIFDRHYLLETEITQRKYSGIYKNGMYAYPHAVVFHQALFVIYSLWKEDIFVQKIPLDRL